MTSTTQAKTRPLRADAERNRRRILDGAAEAFAERGLGVSMDEIAERSGVGVGTVYRRFPEKEQLIHALFEDRLEDMVVTVETALAMEDPFDGLTFFLETLAQNHGENRALKEILFTDSSHREWFARFKTTLTPMADELLGNAKASGQLRADVETSDLHLIQLMLATVYEFTSSQDPEAWKRMSTIVMDGLRSDREDATAMPSLPLSLEDLDDAANACKFPD